MKAFILSCTFALSFISVVLANNPFSVTVSGGSTKAYSYGNGTTKVGLRGTLLLPKASGEAKVIHDDERFRIEVKLENMEPASRFGMDYLTYVLWAISPQGRVVNLGELRLDEEESHMETSLNQFQIFGLVVTAEPDFAVSRMSNAVVLENYRKKKGKDEEVEVKYELSSRGNFTLNQDPMDLQAAPVDKKVSPYVFQARNAVRLARLAGADIHAGPELKVATDLLDKVEQSKNKRNSAAITLSRQAVQQAEDAREVAIKRQTKLAANKNSSQTDISTRTSQSTTTKSPFDGLYAEINQQVGKVFKSTFTSEALLYHIPDEYFETNTSEFKPKLRDSLLKMADVLKDHPEFVIAVEGNEVSTRTAVTGGQIWERRATAVRYCLSRSGVPAHLVLPKGSGKENMVKSSKSSVEVIVMPNEDAADDSRDENRRAGANPKIGTTFQGD